MQMLIFFFFSSRRRHPRCSRDWSSDVCSSDLLRGTEAFPPTPLMAIVLPSAEFSLAEATTLEGFSRPHKTISAVRFRRRLEPHDAALRPSVKRYSWHGMQEWSRWEDKRSSLESAPMVDRALAQ